MTEQIDLQNTMLHKNNKNTLLLLSFSIINYKGHIALAYANPSSNINNDYYISNSSTNIYASLSRSNYLAIINFLLYSLPLLITLT